MHRARRRFLLAGGLLGLGYVGSRFWPNSGIWNPCKPGPLPPELRNHELLLAAWDGVDPLQWWDCHCHLVGVGEGNSGIWVNPRMRSWTSPLQHIQFLFYLNASCASVDAPLDVEVVARLKRIMGDFPTGAKLMLIAFDYYHDASGERNLELSTFHVPNDYAAAVAASVPERFEWIASVHPYRGDAIAAVSDAISKGARAVKWLPQAMGIDPSSSRCDDFYEVLVKHRVPLLVHSGAEHAVQAAELQRLGNPLLLRRALDHGVRVIVAHCASLGENRDIDAGTDGPLKPNIELFARLMDDPRYEGRLYGDISATTQINRDESVLPRLFSSKQWHDRLLNGSDYPLPAVMPLFLLSAFVGRGYLSEYEAEFLESLRGYNPLLFDFALKRTLKIDGARFPASVFETRKVFSRG